MNTNKKLNIDKNMIFCGAGSDSLINVISEVFLDKEDERFFICKRQFY